MQIYRREKVFMIFKETGQETSNIPHSDIVFLYFNCMTLSGPIYGAEPVTVQ